MAPSLNDMQQPGGPIVNVRQSMPAMLPTSYTERGSGGYQ